MSAATLPNSSRSFELSSDNRQALLETVETDLARRSLHEFVCQAWEHVDPDPFVDGVHIEAICSHLEAVDSGEIKNLVINIPPRHTKSLLVAVLWPAWRWIDHPETRWLFASYSHMLSIRDSVKCRRLLCSPWYQARWGESFRLMGDQNAKIRFDNSEGGYRIATSVGGIGTGEGGDRIVVDDPHNVTEVESEIQRESALTWWDAAMSTRGNNPKTVARVIVAQRVHEGDLCGHVLAKGGYEHLCLPAEYEPDHPFKRVTCIGFEDPRRVDGELLCPERFGSPEIARIKADLTPLRAAGQLQQRPAPREGAIFKAEWFRTVKALPVEAARTRFWDLAATETDSSDWTVGSRISRTPDGKFIIEHLRRGRWSPHERDDVIGNVATIDGHEVPIWIEEEPGSGGKAQVAAIVRQLPAYAVRGERATGDPIVRVDPLAAQFEAGNVYFYEGCPCREEAEAELLTFPNGRHDDIVISLAGCYNKAAANLPAVESASDHAAFWGPRS